MSTFSLAPANLVQAINPMSMWAKLAGQQFGFVNVYSQNTSEPDVETRIVQGVASYGRQLGRMMDVLQILLDKANIDPENPPSSLDDAQRQALKHFAKMAADIEQVKRRDRYPRSVSRMALEMAGKAQQTTKQMMRRGEQDAERAIRRGEQVAEEKMPGTETRRRSSKSKSRSKSGSRAKSKSK